METQTHRKKNNRDFFSSAPINRIGTNPFRTALTLFWTNILGISTYCTRYKVLYIFHDSKKCLFSQSSPHARHQRNLTHLSCSSSASRNSSRTFRSASPTHLSRISGPLTSFGGRAPSRRLSSRARRVLPQPGGPWSRRPRTWPTPSACRSLYTRKYIGLVLAGGRGGAGMGGLHSVAQEKYLVQNKTTARCRLAMEGIGPQ